MNLKRYLSALALIAALSGNAEAQSISIESMVLAPRPKENKILRFDGSYDKKDFSAFGLMDFLGDFDSYYGELYLRQNISRRAGVQFEINGGSGFGPVYRAGYIADMPVPEGAYLNVKILPLNVTGNGISTQFQAGVFGNIRFPKGFYLEDWTDYTVEKGARPSVLTEFTAGKHVTQNFALQGQAAYNVGSSGWAFRAGARYRIF